MTYLKNVNLLKNKHTHKPINLCSMHTNTLTHTHNMYLYYICLRCIKRWFHSVFLLGFILPTTATTLTPQMICWFDRKRLQSVCFSLCVVSLHSPWMPMWQFTDIEYMRVTGYTTHQNCTPDIRAAKPTQQKNENENETAKLPDNY